MPIVINELNIQVEVSSPQTTQQTRGVASQGTHEPADTHEALVAECVEQVLQILQNKLER